MRCIACVFALVFVVGACAHQDDGAKGETPPDVKSQEAKVAPPPAEPAEPFEPEPRDNVQPTLTIVTLEGGRVGLDLHAESWPGRALDPVLTVGQLTLTEYEHPSKEVLRFVVKDASLLVPGSQVVLQYGDDASSRVVVTEGLGLTQ